MSFKDECEKYGVVLEGRWEQGIDHHPEANQSLRELFSLDFEEYGDHFRWNVGGDGDNGEVLIEQYSVILELRDAELRERYPSAFNVVQPNSETSILEQALSYIEQTLNEKR